MAKNIDFNALRAQTLGSGNDEEAVTVDTRGLISKVLARYSGKWTVLREMIQNAADANASKVTIKFETLPSTTVPLPPSADQTTLIKHVVSHHTLKRLLISNNGLPFSEKDWARLKRIADGNPDETKIGAFGVGFYSVFDDCEEPFVSSGKDAMAFYWKGNALFTRRLQLSEESNPETTFVLDYRNDSSPIPSLLQLCQFLSSSLTFVSLESIELWLDDWNLSRLTKKAAPSIDLSIPRDIETKTPQGLMKVTSIAREVVQVDAAWMRVVEWNSTASVFRLDSLRDTTGSLRTFFSRLTGQNAQEKPAKIEKQNSVADSEDLSIICKASVFLHISTASIQCSISHSLSSELERATRKPPPKKTTLAVLTPSYDTDIASGASALQSEVLSSILPTKAGRIFIGFPTHQTTGLNAHISAPSVIPTVERESIDLNTRYISKWNLEMLRAAGIVCRVAWSAEMASIKSRILSKLDSSKSSKVRKNDIVGVLPEAIYTANQFVFRESTPSSLLGQTIEDSFWTCNKNASIEILSTCGIIQSHQARIAPKDLSFMDSIPVLPDELVSGAKDFVGKLTDFGLVTEVTVSDIKRELEASTLRPAQITEFLKWLGRKALSGQLDQSSIQSLLSVAVANDEDDEGNPTRLLVFADVNNYLNPQRIPVEFPVPPSVMPFKYIKSLAKQELEALGWVELQTVSWIRWLVNNAGKRNILPLEQDITQTASFSAQILPVLSKQWDNSLSQPSRQAIVTLLQPHTIIPTKLGMRRPAETYFSSVRLFDDLPVVHGLNGVKEKFLGALGVRKTVELGVIFERLLNNNPQIADSKSEHERKWSHVDLIRYLASVRDDIPANDIQKLKKTSICTAEGSGDSKSPNRTRYKIYELFEPKDSLRALGLPIIEWPGNYQPGSIEGKFLAMLGLRSFPSAAELIEIMSKAAAANDWVLHGKAMSYYISEYHTSGYATFDCSPITLPFLPIEGASEISTPSKCFTDDGATFFGFKILRRDLHPHASKFGVKQHPALTECLDRLICHPPSTKRDARVLFKYLAGRVSELRARDIERTGSALIIPIGKKDAPEQSPAVRRVAPKLCYLGESEDYRDIFDFVDFGQEANFFLMAVGSKREPTKTELAYMLVKEPARISSTFQSADKYLKLLRSLAEHLAVFKRDKELFLEMKRSAFLLASRDISSLAQEKSQKDLLGSDDDEIEDQSIKEWTLTAAKDAVVVDDFQSFNLFKEHLLAAPQEEMLENFYLALGAIPLSGLVEERANWGAVAADQRPAAKLNKLINERTRLFLHDQSPNSIRHDVRWLEKNLQVQVVNSISLTRSLKGRRVSHTQKRSAIITQNSRTWVLWICPGKYDLYEISQALVHLILVRPKLHSTLTLEMLLKTDLLELKARGYNVERILKQKAHEARVAEDRRQKQLEEEQERLKEREAAWAKEQAQLQAQEQHTEKTAQPLMPGDFPDSPTNRDSTRNIQPEEAEAGQDRRPRGLFANLTKRFGLEGGRSNWNPLGGGDPSASQGSGTPDPTTTSTPPPPYSAEDPQKLRPKEPASVNPPHRLHSELLSAIQSCRPHGSSGLYSRPETNQVTETKSYCDEKPSHDLEFVATLPCGIHVLFVKTLSDRSAFLSQNNAGINLFASMLIECASVFSLRVDTLSVFYDPGGKTIAFNRAGSIFCNYFYFQQLHEKELLQNQAADRSEAMVYWWVILCHELAHNLVGDHSSAHSYYSEGFVAQYFPKLAAKLASVSKPSSNSSV
ncbi:histidine kinase-like ATPase domain-containing protein [Aspergillus clavatus NRRL 1]|uniref:HATPase_c domain protein, putative n=1 Tax=Aspergillus clavatus (strain ATCC 1007 / CBS 513.65 / DSM 816 / NCTC 3887 / NRRL 1 / QM 1276 / 107) TaxID=344612 RepID=A1CM51_ASPCL|nr:HATPase_c domain protein, putative [Aspergillus clavatus NRRL 1]EAW08638.1 HATPase_c domain protein, putative [Aspergillus clavatus NRRL 1]